MSASEKDVVMPLLPGYSFADPTRSHFPRAQTFSTKAVEKEQNSGAVGLGADVDMDQLAAMTAKLTYTTSKQRDSAHASQQMAPKSSRHASGRQAGKRVPPHVALDKKVLTFNGFFKETVTESADEHYRVRYVKIFYYLEDDTMSVLEPPIPNSGLPQGKLLRRQLLPKDSRGTPWSWKDLNVAMNVTFYGRTFRIISCDEFTRRFLLSNGIELNDFEDAPEDPYLIQRRLVEEPSTLATTKDDFDKLRQFIELDRKVLRFYCVWDDRQALYGELRPFILLYFLVDDTIEIRESHEANDGRDKFPLLLKRQRVPRNFRQLPRDFPAIVLEPGETEQDQYLSPEDLGIGVTINVLGRDLLLHDCDDFTKEFYRRNFGVEDFTPVDLSEPAQPMKAPAPPPHSGFGSHEDSMQSVTALAPRPPKTHVGKLLKYENKALRFSARMDTTSPIDGERRFVVSYQLARDTISIFEPRTRETRGGKFLESTKIVKPGTEMAPQYYTVGDLYPGATLQVFSRTFILEDADAFAINFIKDNLDLYPAEVAATIEDGDQ
eukprot:m.355473 g.355473  ORF g.355473 m.355473 type:complete len:549 (+) comp17261_c0_seq1:265-1911(+)